MKNTIFLILLTLFVGELGFTQDAKTNRVEMEPNAFRHDNILGLSNEVMITYTHHKEGVKIINFDQESLNPVNSFVLSIVNETEAPVEFLEIKLTDEGFVLLGYLKNKKKQSTTFYMQNFDLDGKPIQLAKEVLTTNDRNLQGDPEIIFKLSNDMSKLIFAYVRTFDEMEYTSNVLVYDISLLELHRSVIKETIRGNKQDLQYFSFDVMLTNNESFVTLVEQSFKNPLPNEAQLISVKRYDFNNELLATFNFDHPQIMLFRPSLSFDGEMIRLTGLFAVSNFFRGELVGYNGAYSVHLQQEELMVTNQLLIPFEPGFLRENRFTSVVKVSGAPKVEASFQVQSISRLESGNWVICAEKSEMTTAKGGKYSNYTKGDLMVIHAEPSGQMTWGWVFRKSVTMQLENRDEAKYFNYDNSSVKAMNYLSAVNGDKMTILYKEDIKQTYGPFVGVVDYRLRTFNLDLNEGMLMNEIESKSKFEDPFLMYLDQYRRLGLDRK